MSSVLLTKTFGTNVTNDQNFSQASAQLSQREKNQIIERLIAILSENKLKPWFNVGLKDEYQRRYNHRLPDDWLSIIEECGRDLIEVETISLSNGTKTLIQLPIRTIKKEPTASAPPVRQQQPPLASAPPVRQQQPPPASAPPVRPLQPPAPPEPIKMSPPKPKPEPLVDNNSDELLIDIKPEENSVPNRRPMNGVGAGEQIKPLNGLSAACNGANHLELSNGGAVEDVIYGGNPIPPPILPPIKPTPVRPEDYFDVVVLYAANPYNFIVVPFKNANKGSDFYDLKAKMCEMYDKEENRFELPPELIRKGLFVAAKAKNMWYRVEVMSVICDDPFQMMGYLCDFGEHKTFGLENIQPLYNCFRDLPMQAIRATLATVEPVGNDWDAITSFEFRKMVESKPFVATVYGLKPIDGNPVLSLSLCDTSGADDMYIGPNLIQRNLAKPMVTSI